MIVFAVVAPRTWRHVTHLDKFPIDHVGRRKSEIIADGRRNVQTGSVVSVRHRTLFPKNILKMMGHKWAAIFPFRVTSAIALANSKPAMPAHRLSFTCVSSFEPRN